MIPQNVRESIEMMGDNYLRELRDMTIQILFERKAERPLEIERNNVMITLEHRPNLGNKDGFDPKAYTTLKEFVLIANTDMTGDGVMINRETTRDHLWVEAKWL